VFFSDCSRRFQSIGNLYGAIVPLFQVINNGTAQAGVGVGNQYGIATGRVFFRGGGFVF
jgi:hypothetical protein